jgi:hypothetical protein
MADVEWQPLPTLWPQPGVWTDVGELTLLVFTQGGVPTWEVNRRARAGSNRDDLDRYRHCRYIRGGEGSRTLRSKGVVLRMRSSSKTEDVTSPIG